MKITQKIIDRFDEAVSRGFSKGVGFQSGKMCVEAAICYALDLPHGDDPRCVTTSVRDFKITLNDSNWKSSKSRAKGLRELGIEQLGSKGIVDDQQFCMKLAEKTIKVLIPTLFREVFKQNPKCLAVADVCEATGSALAARNAYDAARDANDTNDAVSAASAAVLVSYAVKFYYVSDIAGAARAAARATNNTDKYLKLSAKLALETLKELNSPGVAWLNKSKRNKKKNK